VPGTILVKYIKKGTHVMMAQPEPGAQPDFGQARRRILTAFLPDLFYALIGPLLIYRLASPHMSATAALLLAGIPPLARVLMRLLRYRRFNPLSILSLLTIALKILIALISRDPRLLLLSGSLITGVHGVIFLASLFTTRPLLLWIVESVVAKVPTDPDQQLLRRWLESVPRSSFAVITAVWGVALLLDAVLNALLASTLAIEQFMLISPIARYSLLGGTVLGTLLVVWIRRSRKWKRQRYACPTVSTPPQAAGRGAERK
jgi:intracellular septation protein A